MRRLAGHDRQGGSGLRAQFSPSWRTGTGLLTAAPWINVVLLIIFFLIINKRVVLQPGVVVDLPQSSFKEGAGGGLMAVVTSVGGGGAGLGEEIIFFDDERFMARDPHQMQRLRESLASAGRDRPGVMLTIHADRQVRHGTVVDLMNMAVDAGMQKVNIAVRPLPPR